MQVVSIPQRPTKHPVCQKYPQAFREGNYVTSKGSSLQAGPRQAERVNKQGLNLPGKAEEAVTNTRGHQGAVGDCGQTCSAGGAKDSR